MNKLSILSKNNKISSNSQDSVVKVKTKSVKVVKTAAEIAELSKLKEIRNVKKAAKKAEEERFDEVIKKVLSERTASELRRNINISNNSNDKLTTVAMTGDVLINDTISTSDFLEVKTTKMSKFSLIEAANKLSNLHDGLSVLDQSIKNISSSSNNNSRNTTLIMRTAKESTTHPGQYYFIDHDDRNSIWIKKIGTQYYYKDKNKIMHQVNLSNPF